LSARSDDRVEIFASASFAQISISPARVIINPNRMHSIEMAIDRSKRFAINVMPLGARRQIVRMMKLRRREPNKLETLNLTIQEDEHGIPFVREALRVIFCEVEAIIPGGDRRLYVGRVLESRLISPSNNGRPLLFSDVTGNSSNALWKYSRRTLTATGLYDAIKTILNRVSSPLPPNIAQTTYEEAGASEDEIRTTLSYGVVDRSRVLTTPKAPAVLKKQIGICVVGTGWGGVHCRYLKLASRDVRLFVCGRNPDKTAHLGRSVGAEAVFMDLETAARDPRIQGLTLALPHDLHRVATEIVAASGKHILVEKPIATSLIDADAMIAATRSAGSILMVAEDMHFRPAVREAINAIVRGDLGEPLYMLVHGGGIRRPQGWAADQSRMGGGVLIDIGVHYIRAMRIIMGEPDAVCVSRAMQVNTKMAGEDSVQLIFSSRFGWQTHMLLTWASVRGDLPDIVVVGDRGTLHIWPTRRYLDYYPVAPRFLRRVVSYVRPYWLQEKLVSPGMQRVRLPIKDREITGYLGEMREFLDAIAQQRVPTSSGEDGRRDLEIVIKAYQALSNQSWTEIAPVN
jgi:predicted dehydrogenase/flavin reductase (DIM6/NTAB) family NADH-FMN oxidoreductase RutF